MASRRSPHSPFPRPDAGPAAFWDKLAEHINALIEADPCSPTAHLHVSKPDRLVTVGLNHASDCPNVGDNCDDHERSANEVVWLEALRDYRGPVQ